MPVEIIFVTGAPRSGTTMLAGCLSRFPAYPYLPECSVLTDIVRERVRSGAKQHPLKFSAFYGSPDRADRLYRALIMEILEGLIGDNRAERYLVLKDPYLLFYLNILPNLISWPMRTVCIFRNPRDAVASLLRVRRREGALTSLEDAIDFELPFFEAAAQAVNCPSGRNPTHFIRYEDFVARQPEALSRLEAFLGFLPNLNEHRGVPLAQMDLDSPWHTTTYEKPITANRIGKHRDKLRAAGIAAVDAAFSPAMSHLTTACLPSINTLNQAEFSEPRQCRALTMDSGCG